MRHHPELRTLAARREAAGAGDGLGFGHRVDAGRDDARGAPVQQAAQHAVVPFGRADERRHPEVVRRAAQQGGGVEGRGGVLKVNYDAVVPGRVGDAYHVGRPHAAYAHHQRRLTRTKAVEEFVHPARNSRKSTAAAAVASAVRMPGVRSTIRLVPRSAERRAARGSATVVIRISTCDNDARPSN